MKKKIPSISVALLMYNEARNIASTLDETVDFCSKELDDWEILVVDDGSKDNSADIVDQYASKNPSVRLVRHETNKGMGAGMRTGIANASKDYFIFNAADGQISAYEINKLVPLLDNADIVLSTYENMRESLGREVMSRAFRVYLRAVADIKFELQGLYLYPTTTAKVIAPLIDANTFYFSFELIRRGIERGLTVETTTMTCKPREEGASKVVNPRRIMKVGKEALASGIKRWFFYGVDSKKSRF